MAFHRLGIQINHRFLTAIVCAAAAFSLTTGKARAQMVTANFQLLTHSSAAGVGASPNWLVFGGTNQPAAYNPDGAFSFNYVDPAGALGPLGFGMAPALTGNLGLQFQSVGTNLWDVSLSSLSFAGKAGPSLAMNQFLNGTNGTPGTWDLSGAAGWVIQYNSNFYLATNADGDPNPADKDAIFTQVKQTGYLLPVSALKAGMDELAFSPDGMTDTNFSLKSYLLQEIQPKLPTNATYLLLTWMDKTHPTWTDSGLPITTNSAVGNMTIAYSMETIPEPSSMALLALSTGAGGVFYILRRRRHRAESKD